MKHPDSLVGQPRCFGEELVLHSGFSLFTGLWLAWVSGGGAFHQPQECPWHFGDTMVFTAPGQKLKIVFLKDGHHVLGCESDSMQ